MKIECYIPPIKPVLNYQEAKLACFFLSHDGKKGWRLPTIDEMEYLRLELGTSILYNIGGWWWCDFEGKTDLARCPNFYITDGEVQYDPCDISLRFLAVRDMA